MGKGQSLYLRAKALIPGGTQLLSKRPEMYLPDHWPAYYSHAKGCEIWDLDENRYIDFTTMGIGTSVFGYADDEIESAVIRAIRRGNLTTLNCPEEVELAELLTELHPWADMARYARSGGEAAAIAIRIARTATARDKVAICGYHGWHDWYLSLNLGTDDLLRDHLLPGLTPAGVPKNLGGTTVAFRYNSFDDLRMVIQQHASQLAAIVMEPVRSEGPEDGYLHEIRSIANRNGIALIFDEITSGFRLGPWGAHMHYGVDPDIAIFGKALSSGFPMAAVVGRREIMEHSQSSFISSTYWTDLCGPAAALATLHKYQAVDAGPRLNKIGKKVQYGWLRAAERSGVDVKVSGIPPLAHFEFLHPQANALATLFIQEMLGKGYLASSQFYATLAHCESIVDEYLDAVAEVFACLAEAARTDSILDRLHGPQRHRGFSRLN